MRIRHWSVCRLMQNISLEDYTTLNIQLRFIRVLCGRHLRHMRDNQRVCTVNDGAKRK